MHASTLDYVVIYVQIIKILQHTGLRGHLVYVQFIKALQHTGLRGHLVYVQIIKTLQHNGLRGHLVYVQFIKTLQHTGLCGHLRSDQQKLWHQQEVKHQVTFSGQKASAHHKNQPSTHILRKK